MKTQALVSVHDVTPEYLPRVARMLALLEDAGVPPTTLLVVPGRDWTPEGLALLREWAGRGYRLAGHGWSHRCGRRRTIYHRIHGLLLSRDQAEHLSRSRGELLDLVRRCHAWFGAQGLPTPELYVPPAWALGPLTRGDLRALPFRWYEVLGGLLDGATGGVRWLPLAGFEADTRFRQVSLRVVNRASVELARRTGRPLRISLHPPDLEYLLGADLERMVRKPWRFVQEEAAMRRG